MAVPRLKGAAESCVRMPKELQPKSAIVTEQKRFTTVRLHYNLATDKCSILISLVRLEMNETETIGSITLYL